tara:strand:+ start:1269 stop:1565 length:297 start_codon:yes stop_codon:yes gene_type:complete
MVRKLRGPGNDEWRRGNIFARLAGNVKGTGDAIVVMVLVAVRRSMEGAENLECEKDSRSRGKNRRTVCRFRVHSGSPIKLCYTITFWGCRKGKLAFPV